MKNIKLDLLILIFTFSFLSTNTVKAQNNKIGLGLNVGNTWGQYAYYDNNRSETNLGLKLYYERIVLTNFSLRANIDLLLPFSEFSQLPLEVSIIYNARKREKYQFIVGVGAGYYYYKDDHSHGSQGPFLVEGLWSYYKRIDAGVLGLHTFIGIEYLEIPIEIKFVFSPVDRDEIVNDLSSGRTMKLYVKSLLVSVAIPFKF